MGQRRWVGVVAGAFVFGSAPAALDLTATEWAWLEAAVPVLHFAHEQQLPLDIVVQPQPTPGASPLAMAYVEGRCKLVFSMRGNAQAQSTLDDMPRDLVGPIVESLAAHELAHCWRHLREDWGTVPAGLQGLAPAGRPTAAPLAPRDERWRHRHEEAYADLVGLAWTLRHHRAHFAAVHAWYLRFRSKQVVDAGPHDSRLWVQMAGEPVRFPSAASIFEQAVPVWTAGLLAEY